MPRPEEKELLNSEKIAVIGYGAEGEAIAKNLRKSGVSFRLGLRQSGASAERARTEGFEVMSFADSIAGATTISMNLPDQVQSGFYREFLSEKKATSSVKRLIFPHGFNTHYGLIPVVDGGPLHLLVAQKGAATGLVEFYGTANALPALLAIEAKGARDEDLRKERRIAEAFAIAMGCNRRGLFWANFKDETDCDLFSEQALLCGGVSSLLRSAYEVMVEAGYNSEAAYFESLFELKLIVDLIWKRGITGMREKISPTARYGDVTRGDRIIDASVKARMKEVMNEVQSGEFAREFLAKISSEDFAAKVRAQAAHPIETIGRRLRAQLSGEDSER